MAKPSTMTILFSFMIIFTLISPIKAADPDMLQDVCVADLNSPLKINGYPCKDISKINASDFSINLQATAPPPNSAMYGFAVSVADVKSLPGLNTLGISMLHAVYAPGGLVPPHTHNQASEMVYLLEGEVDVAFITTSNQLITKTIKKGDVFVFPRGLVHYQWNKSKQPASAIIAFNSQLPGLQVIAPALFTATPPVPVDVLKIAFQVGTEEVEKIKSGLAPKN